MALALDLFSPPRPVGLVREEYVKVEPRFVTRDRFVITRTNTRRVRVLCKIEGLDCIRQAHRTPTACSIMFHACIGRVNIQSQAQSNS